MTWVAPWALIGVVAVVGPLFVHWLARQQSTRLRFPTLTFLTPTPPVSVRRHRIQDWPLLLIRMAMVALAAVALAQPVWLQSARAEATPSRAVVLDTSPSLQRVVPDGGVRVAADAAREAADALVADAAPRSRLVATPDLPTGVSRAAAWLARQPEPRELVVVSDFQTGALAGPDLEVVSGGVGVRLIPMAVEGPVPPGSPVPVQLLVSAAPRDAPLVAAAEAAARQAVAAPTVQDGTEVALTVRVVFAGAPDAAGQREAAAVLDSPELFDQLSAIVADARALGVNLTGTEWRAVDGILTAFTTAAPGSTDSAALFAAILRSGAPSFSLAERNPAVIDPAEVEQWQRSGSVGSGSPSAIEDGRGLGRWLWLLILGLMAAETWVRRSRVDATPHPKGAGA